MKTWTLVWFLIFPSNDDGRTAWEATQESNLTQVSCFNLLAKKNASFEDRQDSGELAGFEIYCKDNRGTPVPVERL